MSKKKKKGDDDGLMSLPECASYLHLSENTVLKLASENKLPGVLVDKKWQFPRELIDEWLQERLNLEDEGIEDIPDPMRVPLGDLLPIEAVLEDLKSTEPLGVIEELAALAYNQSWLNDKPWFVGALVEREALSSTAMEGGVAFLHTRSREAGKVARPFVIVGRSYNGVDFGAPDGKPTFLFFLLGLKYDRLHLPILGRLARTMLNPATIGKLRSQPSVTKMRALLLKEDAQALLENKQVPVQYEAIKPTLDRQMRLRAIMRLNAMRKHQAKKAADEAKKKSKKAATDKSAEPKAKKAATAKSGASTSGASKSGASKSNPSKSTSKSARK
jgi:excisionase family DNA binding protein